MKMVAPETVGLSRARLDKLTAWMDDQVASHRLAGLRTMIHRRGECAYFYCTGHIDLEAGRPVTEDTIYRIYSMTKPITAAAAMICYEDGHFQLDDPIAKFLPEFSEMQVWDASSDALITVPAARYITVRHLLPHTAGFTYEFMEAGPVEEFYRQKKIIFNPGRRLEDGADLAETTRRQQPRPWCASPGRDGVIPSP